MTPPTTQHTIANTPNTADGMKAPFIEGPSGAFEDQVHDEPNGQAAHTCEQERVPQRHGNYWVNYC